MILVNNFLLLKTIDVTLVHIIMGGTTSIHNLEGNSGKTNKIV